MPSILFADLFRMLNGAWNRSNGELLRLNQAALPMKQYIHILRSGYSPCVLTGPVYSISPLIGLPSGNVLPETTQVKLWLRVPQFHLPPIKRRPLMELRVEDIISRWYFIVAAKCLVHDVRFERLRNSVGLGACPVTTAGVFMRQPYQNSAVLNPILI